MEELSNFVLDLLAHTDFELLVRIAPKLIRWLIVIKKKKVQTAKNGSEKPTNSQQYTLGTVSQPCTEQPTQITSVKIRIVLS